MKKKLSKLQRSNLAHRSLEKYHAKRSNGENVNFINMNYHSVVAKRQKDQHRVFNQKEKQKIYNEVVCDFF